MLPNHNQNHNRSHNPSSSFPVTSPPPGHQRNRIACSNCRRRKVKCIITEKKPRSSCERCAKDGATCEYVAVAGDEETSHSRSSGSDHAAPPTLGWVEPLDPESYARSKGVFPPATAPQVPSMYAGYGAQAAGPPGYPQGPYQQYEYPRSQFVPPSSGGRGSLPGNQFPPANTPYPNTPYPDLGPGGSRIHYGPFPGPANTVYPWTQPQPRSRDGGCICTTPQCACGRRGAQ
ncbi:hypothetical protein C8R44DRAFT_119636 [Mycena epipterygia]|nr:hypothetical protein C8R44DRAFT_119636 [Mycena epipterygia]